MVVAAADIINCLLGRDSQASVAASFHVCHSFTPSLKLLFFGKQWSLMEQTSD